MKSSEAHALNDQQLVERLRDSREEAFNLRFRHATGELEDTSRIGGSKRDVARLLTIARERGIDIDRELARFDDESKK
jgi:large subunit ribosomal protein L29